MYKLLKRKALCDVLFIVGQDSTYPAHSAIIKYRCPPLHDIIQQEKDKAKDNESEKDKGKRSELEEMKEQDCIVMNDERSEKRVEVILKDIDAHVFAELLYFIYTGEVSHTIHPSTNPLLSPYASDIRAYS